jgi:hypothetical protein
MSRVFLAAAAVALSSCVTYDFEPVHPIAVAQTTKSQTVAALGARPNVMLLLDKSGSMNLPIDPNCTSNCRTRIDELRGAMGPFLLQNGAVARFGLTTFPQGAGAEQCSPPGAVRVDIAQSNDVDQELAAHAASIDAIVQGLGSTETVGGGTPTAASLGVVGQLPSLADPQRSNVVVLLTDGLPNCNAQNPVTVGAGGSCKCTQVASFDPAACVAAGVQGCLDESAPVQAVRALASQQIQTAVIGFGADTNGSALLDQMAFEGGLSRSCAADADCGASGPCNAGLCRTRYYQANDGAALAQVLRDIVSRILRPCEYQLGFTPDPDARLAVLIDGQAVAEDPANTWRYDAASSTVFLTGGLCARAEASSINNPMQIEIRVLEVID